MKKTKISIVVLLASTVGALAYIGKGKSNYSTKAANLNNLSVQNVGGDAYGNSLPPASLLCRVGKGVDVTRCGLYAYDSHIVDCDVFDRNWLNSYYSNGFKDTTVAKSDYSVAMTDDVSTIENDLETSFNTYAFAEGSMDFYKAKITTDIGFSTSVKLSKKETALVYACDALTMAYTYELPSYKVNLATFKNNLNAGFLDEVEEAYADYTSYISGSGRSTKLNSYNKEIGYQFFYPIFEKYGTHVVWKAGFGGALSIVYSARSKAVNLSTCLTSDIKSSITASFGVGEGSGSIGGGTNFSLSEKLNVASSEIKEEMTAHFYGGDPGGAGFATSFSEISKNADGWMRTIATSPTVISYNLAYPIWDFLPGTGILDRRLKQTMQLAFNSYQTFRSKGYIDTINSYYVTGNQLVDVEAESNYMYFAEKAPLTKEWDLGDSEYYYDIDVLKRLGFKSLRVEPVFNIKKIDNATGRQYDVTVKASFGSLTPKETTFSIRYLKKDGNQYYYFNGRDLAQTIDLDSLKSNSKFKLEFSVNKAWFLLSVNEAEVENLRITYTYSK